MTSETLSAVTKVARDWEAACRAGDPDTIVALLAEGATVWFNFLPEEFDRPGYRRFLEDGAKGVTSRAYHDFRVLHHPRGFIEQATLECTVDGGLLSAPFCLFATVQEGKITRIEEYFDSSTLAPVTQRGK